MPPSRHQISTWVVDAWKQVPEDLVYKSFIVCGYKDPNAPVIDEKCTAIIEAKSDTDRQQKVVDLVRHSLGDTIAE